MCLVYCKWFLLIKTDKAQIEVWLLCGTLINFNTNLKYVLPPPPLPHEFKTPLLPRCWNHRYASSCSAMTFYTLISLMCVSFPIPFPNQLRHPADSFIKEVKHTWVHVSTHIGFTSWEVLPSFKFSPRDLWEFLLSHLQLVLPFRACIIDLNEWVSLCILK